MARSGTMRFVFLATALGAAVACGKLAQLDDLEIDPCFNGACTEDGGITQKSDTGVTNSDSGIPNVDDASTDANDAYVAPPCPGKGPPGVRTGQSGSEFCIDSTEVTVAQYNAFMTAKAGDTTGQPAECAWNKSYTPISGGSGAEPVRGVDWCDARAYCAWAGKRLCGKTPVGGVGAPLTGGEVLTNEWFYACSTGGTTAFGYGDTYKQGNCNVQHQDGGLLPVGTLPLCQGIPGVYDLIGNVFEWIDFCTAPAVDAGAGFGGYDCRIAGGTALSGVNSGQPPASYNCQLQFQIPRTYAAADLGFRCCSP